MARGDHINVTEGRAVLHTALRVPRGAGPFSDEVHATLDAMLAFADEVRATAKGGLGGLGDPGAKGGITDVVNIGIGGSDLGPRMAVAALDALAQDGPRLHFVSNVDGHDLTAVLRGLDARRTLFIVARRSPSSRLSTGRPSRSRIGLPYLCSRMR